MLLNQKRKQKNGEKKLQLKGNVTKRCVEYSQLQLYIHTCIHFNIYINTNTRVSIHTGNEVFI